MGWEVVYMDSFAARLRRRREQLGLSQAQLADELGTKQPGVAAWETGVRVPTTESVRRLAGILRVSPGWLAFGPAKVEKTGSGK